MNLICGEFSRSLNEMRNAKSGMVEGEHVTLLESFRLGRTICFQG